jgi:hypothetical protein
VSCRKPPLMKIFILNTPRILQPEQQVHLYPVHNKDYGVEQDFHIWLKKQKNLLTDVAAEADWHYLPVYWTRWHINHHFAANGEGLAELQARVDQVMLDTIKTFTITQFDGGTLVNTGKCVVFTAARTNNPGIDIPILCSTHRTPPFMVKKKYLGTFNGSFDTHPIRIEMKKRFENNPEVIVGGTLPTRFYKRWFWAKSYNLNTMASYVALCPRGTSCNSFRFFEALQFGVAPCLIGDRDVRPFKKFIPWDEFSYYVANIDELEELLKNLNKKKPLTKEKTRLNTGKTSCIIRIGASM